MTAFLGALLREFYENESGMSEELYVNTSDLIEFLYGQDAAAIFRRAVDATDGRFYINDDIGGFHDLLKALHDSREYLKA